MNKKPHISVLTTAYNRSRYIAETIESVLQSTYQDWEMVISDDCSTDDTVSIAQRYAAKDNRIKVYVNEKNLGDYANRNRVAFYASGKYLKYLDSDDLIFPEALNYMVINMEQHQNAGWGICNFLPRKGESNLPVCIGNKEAYEFHYFNHPIFFASPGLTIITKNAFDAVGGFGEKRMVGDFDMWHKLSNYSPVVLMPDQMIVIREHPGQEIKDRFKYAVEYEKVKFKYLHDSSCPLTAKQVKTIEKERRNTVLKIAMRKLLKLDIKGAMPRLKVFWFYIKNGFKGSSVQ